VHYDVVIAGGGTAGCVLAGRLSEEAGRTVCLVEAGPDYGAYAEGRWPDDILDARWLAIESHCWQRDNEEDRSQLRARILGGCSAHNACVVLRGANADYDEWGPGWTAAELRPYLERAERALRTHPLAAGVLSPWLRAFAAGAGGDAILHDINTIGTVRWNAAFAYVDPARDRPNLTILADTLVDRVLLDGNRAAGIATSAGDLTASTVVVAASAYGSPAILLRSGIGPETGLPVGENLSDHVGAGMGWEPTNRLRDEMARFEAEQDLWMAQVSVELRSRSCAEELWDLLLFPAAEPGCEISAAVFAMKPRSRGRVSLTSSDPHAPLAIEHGFLSDQTDEDVLVEGFERLREFGRSEPMRRYAAREIRPGEDVDAATHVRATARGFFHPTGTCRIGSVVDERGRVYGYEHLCHRGCFDHPVDPAVEHESEHGGGRGEARGNDLVTPWRRQRSPRRCTSPATRRRMRYSHRNPLRS
jgi:choline dehydrogenase